MSDDGMKSHFTGVRDLCPGCGTPLDMASNVGGKASPKAKDLSICARCGDINQFDENLVLVEAEEGWEEHVSPRDLQAVRLLQEQIRRRGVLPPRAAFPDNAEEN